MDFLMQNILVLVCFFPLMGIPIILLIPKGNRSDSRVKWTANIVAFCGFIISLPLIIYFNRTDFIDATTGMRFLVRKDWINAIGADFYIGIDGISLLLILLTTLLGFIAILSSWSAITERVREYYCYLLLLQTGMLGVFIALDFVVTNSIDQDAL